MNLMLAQPFDQTYKTGVNQQNIRVEFSVFFLEFKGRLLSRVGKYAAGMMIPPALLIVQQQNRFFRAGFSRIGTICGIGAPAGALLKSNTGMSLLLYLCFYLNSECFV